MGREGSAVTPRRIVYCVIPRALAQKLYELLRQHFRDDPTVEVVVEGRDGERRSATERRLLEPGGKRVPTTGDRRLIRSLTGRRVSDRRAATVPVEVPPLPRKARPFADQLLFVERLEPSAEQLEDADTGRLVTRIQAGDRESFATLYARYFDRVYGYVQVVLKGASDAEDVTQQIFTEVFEALGRYELRGQPFRAWLFVVARNRTLTHLQKHGRLEAVDPADLSRRYEAISERDEVRALEWISDRDLHLFVDRLPLAQRQVLFLRYRLGFTMTEVASVLGSTPEAVQKQHSRALGFLQARLVALGRDPTHGGRRIGSRTLVKQSRVLRLRRFSLVSSGPTS
jgi:RNA polymerase sigma-70 factor (ECF subfamily)